MPAKGFTCITIGRGEYAETKTRANALGKSVRELVVEAVKNYYWHSVEREKTLLDIDILLVDLESVARRLELLKKWLQEPQCSDEASCKAYMSARAVDVGEALSKLLGIRGRVEELKKALAGETVVA